MRWLSAWQLWWPAVAVWLLVVLPMLALQGAQTREATARLEWRLPWYFRALLVAAEHAWPYSALWRIGARIQRSLDPDPHLWSCRACRTRIHTDSAVDHALTHFIANEDTEWERVEWTPPMFGSQEEADRWLEARSKARERSFERVIDRLDAEASRAWSPPL